MSLKRQHLEPLTPTSATFIKYQTVFGVNRLVNLIGQQTLLPIFLVKAQRLRSEVDDICSVTSDTVGQHLEPLAPISSEFLQYQRLFGVNKLAKLYKIVYQPTGTHCLEQFTCYPIFFHGTGHCGCLLKRGTSTESTKINASDWCGVTDCATQGILNHGHLRTYSGGGHFFSPNWSTAQGYALRKSGQQTYLPIFLVKARYGSSPYPDICSVPNDTMLSFY
ncbi:hypothetical protein BG015_012057 [Linnemannia schmuckeri]|uniref:Uncharacterized protein n=1 Tax=Linnemannia schmuckeri TaxID=64567 RepID=A0A9P5RS66_9FUNG|nr:hypothetical protein BG015_012057 [Linnemannia schmuckeri]